MNTARMKPRRKSHTGNRPSRYRTSPANFRTVRAGLRVRGQGLQCEHEAAPELLHSSERPGACADVASGDDLALVVCAGFAPETMRRDGHFDA